MLQVLKRMLSRVPGARPGERDPLGPAGERLAARHMKRQGCRVLGRNLRVPMGEADLLCEGPDGRTIILVEVKTRRALPTVAGSLDLYAPPELSVTAEKQKRLAHILRHLARHNGWTHRPLRIDVVAIEWAEGLEPVLRHHVDAVKSARSVRPSGTNRAGR